MSNATKAISNSNKFWQGIQFKLMMGMALIALMAVAASGFGLLSFNQIEKGLLSVTREGLPTINVAQSLAQQSSALASSGPALNASRTQEERELTFSQMSEQLSQLHEILNQLKSMTVDSQQVALLQKLLDTIENNINIQNKTIENRIAQTENSNSLREEFIQNLSDLNIKLQPAIKNANQFIFGTSQLISAEIPSSIGKIIDQDLEDLTTDARLMRDAVFALFYLRESLSSPINEVAQKKLETFSNAVDAQEIRLSNRDPKTLALLGMVLRLVDNPSSIDKKTYTKLMEKIDAESSRVVAAGVKIAKKRGGEIQGFLSERMDLLTYEGAGELSNLLKVRGMIEKLKQSAVQLSSASNQATINEIATKIEEQIEAISSQANELESDESIDIVAESLDMLRELTTGDTGLSAVRSAALQANTSAGELLEKNLTLGSGIVLSVKEFVKSSLADTNILSAEAENILNSGRTIQITIAAIGIIVWFLVAVLYVGRQVSRRLVDLAHITETIAGGNLEVRLPRKGHDEITRIADAVRIFRDNGREMEKLRAEQIENEHRIEEEKRASMLKLADDFENSVKGIVDQVGMAAGAMRSSAQSMSELANNTSAQATSVAAAAEETTANVETVAGTTKELVQTSQTIHDRMSHSSNVVNKAAEEANRTSELVEELSGAAEKIGDVVNLIQDIAEQTNLLALNATIESARAGDAGKGFAVVANEVKSLAGQTGQATEDISKHISGIQQVTENAVSAIQTIAETVSEVGDLTAEITISVEEQNSATQEIGHNVQQASAGTKEVTETITAVTLAANETGGFAEDLLSTAEELATQAQALGDQVDNFLVTIRK